MKEPPAALGEASTPGGRTAWAAWALALAAGLAALALLDYRPRDADSRLYGEIAARSAATPVADWIAPTVPPGWYLSGRFREHPAGLFVPAALLARLGYPPGQAALAMNALYQVLTVVMIQRLAATLVPGLEARALGWLIQLLPVAFTFRIRANQEQALVLCLVAALYGTERARSRPAWAALVVAALCGLLLVKGVLAVFGPALCVLWLLARRFTAPGPAPGGQGAWWGIAAAVAAMGATAILYEYLYRQATGEPFLSVYLARQLGTAASNGAGLALDAANVVWYLGRVLWFPFPWSLMLLACAWRELRSRVGTGGVAPAPGDPGARAGAWFAAAVVVLYVGAFALSDRRAERYVFPAYYAVGAAGAVAALRLGGRLRRVAVRLDRPWVAPAFWAALFAAHLVAGRLGVPTIKVWAPDTL